MFWAIVFGGLILLGAASVFYLLTRFHRFAPFQRLGQSHRALSWLAAALPVLALFGFAVINIPTVIVVLIHLMVIWILCDLIGLIVRKIAGKPRNRHYPEGICALLLTAGILSAGWYFAHHVYETHYQFRTDKALENGSLRIVLLADSHLGITLDGEKFAKQAERIAAAKPDLVLLAGDFVDDDSKAEDMERAAQALGSIPTTYGVFYSHGNHDRGYYKSRGFTIDDVKAALERNGVTVLEDETTAIGSTINIVGRLDKSYTARMTAEQVTGSLDRTRYTVCLDHQPNDYAAEAAAGIDLVVSGHTHGGHIFPAGYIGLLAGMNDRVYGTERRGSTDFVVTSGISGWAIPFKTGTISEYVVIDITAE